MPSRATNRVVRIAALQAGTAHSKTGNPGSEANFALLQRFAREAANEADRACARELVDSSEANTGSEVEQLIGDKAYGSMETREALGEREVIAPTVKLHSKR